MDWPEVTKYRGIVSSQNPREEIIQGLYKRTVDGEGKNVHGGMIRCNQRILKVVPREDWKSMGGMGAKKKIQEATRKDYGVDRPVSNKKQIDAESQLAHPLLELMKMLFNVETYRAAMMEFEINMSEMPLVKECIYCLNSAYLLFAYHDMERRGYLKPLDMVQNLIKAAFGPEGYQCMEESESLSLCICQPKRTSLAIHQPILGLHREPNQWLEPGMSCN